MDKAPFTWVKRMTELTTSRSRADRLLEKHTGFMTVEDFADGGVNRVTIRSLVAEGRIANPAWGLYIRSDIYDAMSENRHWALVAYKFPQAVFSLLSAALFHDITQENHPKLTVFMPRIYGDKPKMGGDFSEELECLVTRSTDNLTVGVKEYDVDGVSVRVTSPERTIVDMMRFSSLGSEGRDNVTHEAFFDALQYMSGQDTVFDFDEVAVIAHQLGCGEEMSKLTRAYRFRAQATDSRRAP